MHGLDIDALLSVRIVTATGDLITASATQNSELFWGLRGGGANFGIITYATYRIFDYKNNGQITNIDFLLGPAANKTVWELISAFDDREMPAELSIQVAVRYNATAGETQLFLNSLYFGPMAEAMPYIDEFIKVVRPNIIRQSIEMVPWNKIFYNVVFGPGNRVCSYNNYISLYTIGLKNNNVNTYTSMFADVAAFNKANPGYRGQLTIARFPTQAVLAVPDSATAFPWRKSKTNVYAFPVSVKPSPLTTLLQLLRQQLLRPQLGRQSRQLLPGRRQQAPDDLWLPLPLNLRELRPW